MSGYPAGFGGADQASADRPGGSEIRIGSGAGLISLRTIAHHRPKTVTKPLPGASAGYAPERRSQRELLRPL